MFVWGKLVYVYDFSFYMTECENIIFKKDVVISSFFDEYVLNAKKEDIEMQYLGKWVDIDPITRDCYDENYVIDHHRNCEKVIEKDIIGYSAKNDDEDFNLDD